MKYKTNRVVSIGLDAADPELLEKWMAAGHLPNLAKIYQQGAYTRLHNRVNYQNNSAEFASTEPLWVMLNTGCLPDKTGFWDTITFNPTTYRIGCDPVFGGYDYQEYKPFYALGEKYKVATFDLPVSRVVPGVNGLQITGWGGHHPFHESKSQPPELLEEITKRYGQNPIYRQDNGIWWDRAYRQWVMRSLETSTRTRAQICLELLAKDDWDLFMVGFGETHTAGHDLYHLSQPDHPLYSYANKQGRLGDPMLEAFQHVDRAIGEILTSVSDDTYILLFALHGMGANHTDLLSMMFLPELLYRFNFPGKVAISANKSGENPGAVISKNIRNSWPGEVWRQIYQPNPLLRFWNTWTHKKFLRGSQHGLLSPYPLTEKNVELGWMPATLYSPLWPQMKAFAMPAFADGHIRINLEGRERDGIVASTEYESICDRLTEILGRLVDGRSGQPLVKQVIRTRRSALECDPKLPEPDLVVVWHERSVDVVDSPDLGRIGPITYNRPGGHRNRGFLLAKGAGISPSLSLPEARAVDVSATILKLLGATIPDYFDGQPLLEPTTSFVREVR
jgi:predicted AlkP superfamily phosphohydrolase/phosphomutase